MGEGTEKRHREPDRTLPEATDSPRSRGHHVGYRSEPDRQKLATLLALEQLKGYRTQPQSSEVLSSEASTLRGEEPSQTPTSQNPDSAAPTAADRLSDFGGGRPYPHLDRIQASFGRHDISGVTAHIGGPAAASATALGAEAYTHGNAVAFRSEPSLWLAAHEAAHVVHQRRGVEARGGAADLYEQHADAVADAVVAGGSAEALLNHVGGSASAGPSVQCFVESEHKAIGDEGSGGARYKFPGMELSHGDLVMLSGDHFTPSDLRQLANIFSPTPGQLPNTQDEIYYVLVTELGSRDPRFAPGGVWAHWTHVKFSNQVKKSVEERYYKLAAQNDMHFSNPHGPGSAGSEGSAGRTYRVTHEEALRSAYDDARQGNNNQRALVLEATGQHFLTDSFASGHTSTPRTSISEYWNRKYPNFGQQFMNKIAHDVAIELGNDATGLADAIPVSLIEDKAKAMIMAKLGAKPLPKIGHIVSLTIHATDNRDGLQVDNDRGWRWRAYGDHKLEPPDGVHAVAVPAELQIAGPACTMSNRNIAVTAVQLGIEEVQRAYALGKDGANAPMADKALLQHIRQHPTSLTQAGATYAPEQVVPDIDAARPDNGSLNWMVADLATLWVTRIRTTKPETYGDFIANDMLPDGQMGGELDAIRAQLDEVLNPRSDWVPIHGHFFPRRAFEKAVLEKLRSKDSCLAYLLQIVNT